MYVSRCIYDNDFRSWGFSELFCDGAVRNLLKHLFDPIKHKSKPNYIYEFINENPNITISSMIIC